MANISSGNILFGGLLGKSEGGTAGTSPSFATGGRRFLGDVTGLITLGKTYEIGDTRSLGYRNSIIATNATLTANDPELSLSFPEVSVDDAAILFGMAFSPTISGTAAPYTWTTTPSLGSASNSPTSYSFIAQDAFGGTAGGGNGYLLNYVLPTELSITGSTDGLTSMTASCFAQNVAESTTNPAAATAVVTSKRMAGRLWTVAVGTALATGSFTDYSYPMEFGLTIQTGINPVRMLNGSTSLTGHAESGQIGGELTMTVLSNASASSTWYQSLGSQKFVRLTWSDGTYSLTINTSIIVTDITPLSGEADGLTQMAVTGRLALDPVSLSALKITAVNALAALP